MRGEVLRAGVDAGLILGADGNRYEFAPADWLGGGSATAGIEIDFVPAGATATEIYPLKPALPLQQATPAIIPTSSAFGAGYSVLLGAIGIFCLLLNFGLPFLPLIASLILGLVGASSAKRFHNRLGLILSRISWIGSLVLTVAWIVFLGWGLSVAWPHLRELLDTLREMARQRGVVA